MRNLPASSLGGIEAAEGVIEGVKITKTVKTIEGVLKGTIHLSHDIAEVGEELVASDKLVEDTDGASGKLICVLLDFVNEHLVLLLGLNVGEVDSSLFELFDLSLIITLDVVPRGNVVCSDHEIHNAEVWIAILVCIDGAVALRDIELSWVLSLGFLGDLGHQFSGSGEVFLVKGLLDLAGETVEFALGSSDVRLDQFNQLLGGACRAGEVFSVVGDSGDGCAHLGLLLVDGSLSLLQVQGPLGSINNVGVLNSVFNESAWLEGPLFQRNHSLLEGDVLLPILVSQSLDRVLVDFPHGPVISHAVANLRSDRCTVAQDPFIAYFHHVHNC